jgi:hypothetical protein
MRLKEKFILLILWIPCLSYGQTDIDVYLDSTTSSVNSKYEQGVFYVPKTNEAQTDFLNNGIYQNSIRLNIIESALNNTTNLNDCITYLDNASSILQNLASKTDKLLFIFEKMPAWLSSSSDGSPASTPGWYILNTKPPASWTAWNNMVNTVIDRIINVYGITNAYFEIWNEPDLGSWTGTNGEYFELFKNTYDAIKSVNINIPVGGPATNHWGKGLNYEPPYGYLTNQIADSSLIGQLIDSTYTWNRPLDFISWHNFNVVHQTNKNAVDYIIQKYTNLGLTTPELMVSEWNTPSSVRDTPLQKSFFIKSQIEMAKTPINNNMVAAWQDFNQSTTEFHNDYGLLTYGSIHKPAYNALLLSDKISGTEINNTYNAPTNILTTVSNDTLNILISNYVPPAFIEAFNHTLFEGHFNANQIDSLGYIDITTNNFNHLDSIYKGLIIIPSSNPINSAINNSIPIYSHYDSIQINNRIFNLNVSGITGVHSGINYKIDSTNNNMQFKYDSLLLQGYTQANSILYITNNQALDNTLTSLNNGQIVFSMQPNSVQLFQFVIPEILSTNNFSDQFNFIIFPNPTNGVFEIKSEQNIGKIKITDINGKVIKATESNENNMTIDLLNYTSGIYFIHFIKSNKTVKIIRK